MLTITKTNGKSAVVTSIQYLKKEKNNVIIKKIWEC